MEFVRAQLNSGDIATLYAYAVDHPEIVLLLGAMLFLILQRKIHAMLILVFGVALCSANYFMLTQFNSLAIPPLYAAGFGGLSIILLLLLLYEFIHTA